MNDNDVADQLRLIYRIMRFQHNNKWWWALWLWGLEVGMVNAYCMYKRYCELMGFNQVWNHHDFMEAIAHAFVDPSTWPARSGKSPPKRNNISPKNWASKKAQHFNSKSLSATDGVASTLR